ncbi:MAG: PilZ domain-containing protein [Oligoflexia bacterium]|nr:PilZ domain-containing protein [Oligoflexia bacterium]
MRTRPWPLVILALFHVLSPVVNVPLSAWLDGLSVDRYLTLLWLNEGWYGIFDALVLLPIGGAAIYLCKRWSFPIFLAVVLQTAYSNFQTWYGAPQAFPIWAFLGTALLDVALVAYFFFPKVRAVFLNPRLRWWESQPRFAVRLRARAGHPRGDSHCVIQDLSEGGAFVKATADWATGETIELTFSFFELSYRVTCRVAYRRNGKTRGYGLQFHPTAETRIALIKLTQGLELTGLRSRGAVDLKQDFTQWLKLLLTSGKGLLPDVPAPRPASPPIPLKQTEDDNSSERKAA